MPETKHIGDLKPDPANARAHNPRNIGMIVDALHEVGAARSIVIDENDVILAGNGVIEAAAQAGIEGVRVIEATGSEIIAVRRTGLTPEQKRRLSYFDNRTAELAEWEPEQIKLDLDEGFDFKGLFQENELNEILAGLDGDGGEAPEPRQTLAERFLVPPFSVLDARQGYWQERKRAWLALGIQSELGRGEIGDGEMTLGAIPPNQATILSPDYTRIDNTSRKAADRRSNIGKAAVKPEWAISTGTVNMAVGTSIFDPVLCEIAYRWFCPPGGKVLDPFAGGSVRGIVAAWLGREYVGVELRGEQVEANRTQAQDILHNGTNMVPVRVSGKWARHQFSCNPEYIVAECQGRCCEGTGGIMVSLLPSEVVAHQSQGFDVREGFLSAAAQSGKCPHKLPSGLCGVHGTDMKPFGCVASPFTLNQSGTLIVRQRYTRLRCHGAGQPAFKVFRASLDALFGLEESSRICREIEAGVSDIPAKMPRPIYENVLYLDRLKHETTIAVGGMPAPEWIVGDSKEIENLAPGAYDFLFSCPPYYDLEVYSDSEGELSAIPTYAEFKESYRHIIREALALLKDDRFACFVVGEIRDKRGMYRHFVGDTVAAFRDAGAELYNEAILVTAVGSLPIRAPGIFEATRKLGKTHQNVLVFVKGDPRKATEACGLVEIAWPVEAEQEGYTA